MSYDYYLQAYQHSAPQQIKTEKILHVVQNYITVKDQSFVDLKFDELNECTLYINSYELTNSGLNIHRPCSGEQFIRCIHEIMQLGNFILFEPDGKQVIISDPNTEMHLPAEMIEALGKPVVATDWLSFQQLFLSNR